MVVRLKEKSHSISYLLSCSISKPLHLFSFYHKWRTFVIKEVPACIAKIFFLFFNRDGVKNKSHSLCCYFIKGDLNFNMKV
ncbi:hypothetical protein O3M35_007535 [Rhynocoris fuscipes]|uniref:Uncharacterized protein n=1 Tax=Rhynocoris fuscipes TaxID=488301 RepID=A0AAW1DAG5_9HEMI